MLDRFKPRGAWDLSRLVLLALATAWFAGLAAILRQRLFVTNDSISNYAHVWFVSGKLWDGILPFRFPEIGHGDALAFPYAFVPWLTAAIFRPLLGDWVVTLWLVGGAGGLLWATWWAFPELRRAAIFAVVLANPMLVEAVILAQLPFLWATAALFAAVGAWRRGWVPAAVALMGLAQATHPAVVMPLAGMLVVGWFPFEAKKKRFAAAYAVSLVVAAPAVAMVFLSPVVEDSTAAGLLTNFAGTVSLRALVVFAPMAAIVLGQRLPDRGLTGLALGLVVLNVLIVPLRHNDYAWGAFTRAEDKGLVPFLESKAFAPGATYRILRSSDGKVGMYQIIRHGGKLDSEFFPESIDRRSWSSSAAYLAFLRGREVDYVIIYRLYDERHRTNEHDLLETLAWPGCTALLLREFEFDVYHVDRSCAG